MARMLLLAVVQACVCLVRGQQMSSDGCFEIYQNSKVNCVQSYKTQAVGSEQQCRELCAQDVGQCKSAQYAQASQQCDLFTVFIPVGQAGRRKRDLDSLFRSRRGTGSYLGTGQGYRPAGGTYPAPAPSYRPPPATYPAPQPSYRPQPAPAPAPSYRPAGGAGASYQPKPTYQAKPTYGGGGQCGGYGPTVQSVTGCTYCRPTGTCLGVQTTVPPPPPTTPTPSCPAGQVLRYYKAENYKIQGTPDFTFATDSEQACVTACSNNQQPTGTAAMCKSADYNSQTKQCQVYSSQAFPTQGTAASAPEPGTNHYEKVCVDATLGNRCQGPFVLAPQMILIGYAQTVTTAASQAECLNLCANSQSRFGFACQSGMFYFQETSNNCILNSESKSTHPDVFNQEATDKVTYFETACPAARVLRASLREVRNRNVLQLDTPDFGSWTLCDHMVLDHKRFKGCSTLNPNKCTRDENICDPKKEDEYDLQIVQPIKHGQHGQHGLNHSSNARTTRPPNDEVEDGARLVTKAINKESVFQQVQARDSGHSQTGPVLPPGKCFPLVNLDGSKDCQHGTMFTPTGKRTDCVPTFAECLG